MKERKNTDGEKKSVDGGKEKRAQEEERKESID